MVDTHRLLTEYPVVVPTIVFLAAAIVLVGIAMIDPVFGMVVIGGAIGAVGGLIVFLARSGHGLSASLTSEREPSHAGTINIAHIPVIGIGGLGLVAMAAFVAWFLPRGQVLMAWSVAGAIVGATAFLMWRHFFHGGSPFEESPRETLHLR
jgi:hypothetical protein